MRINKIKFLGNNIFGNTELEFYDVADTSKEPYTTIIIGPNGTGKSFLLRYIILIFNQINNFKFDKYFYKSIKGDFSITYTIGKNQFEFNTKGIVENDVTEFDNNENLSIYNLDLKKSSRKEDIILPDQIIALSNILTDRFPQSAKDFKIYNYSGLRTSSNTARTSSFINRTVKMLFEALEKDEKYEDIYLVLKFLELKKYLFIWYIPRYKNVIFSDNLTTTKFRDFFESYWKYTKRTEGSPPWSLNYFNRIKHDNKKILDLVKLCKKIKNEFINFKDSKSQYFGLDIFSNIFTKEELLLINELHELDLISKPSLTFQKENENLEIDDLSSGEYLFISSMISIMSKIKENTVVLIDEPENSLHPNWQLKYISAIKKVFKKYKNCHFVISTHSPLMVSDLDGKSSTIISLKKSNNQKDKINIKSEKITQNTFGWSAEEVLTKVFETPSSRNYYLTNQLSEIFKLISQNPTKQNSDLIKMKVSKLKEIDLSGLSKEDPLKDVINKLFEKFS